MVWAWLFGTEDYCYDSWTKSIKITARSKPGLIHRLLHIFGKHSVTRSTKWTKPGQKWKKQTVDKCLVCGKITHEYPAWY